MQYGEGLNGDFEAVFMQTDVLLSVVVCTHNPRRQFLERVLNALAQQDLPKEKWELFVVDNNSKEPVERHFDLSWHPRGRHLTEPRLGLTCARVCGIRAAQGDVIVFVDDDNVLTSNYLSTVLRIEARWPMIGAWGGQMHGEFERPPETVRDHLHLIAVCEFSHDRWSNNADDLSAHPVGAGLCIRRDIADRWVALTEQDERRHRLSRKGGQLNGGEDTDLVFTALSLNYGIGRFSSLVLTHLIPKERLEEGYLVRVAAGSAWSDIWLRGIWQREIPIRPPLRALLAWIKFRFKPRLDRSIFDARERAMRAAQSELRKGKLV